MDTDVEVVEALDLFLNEEAFMGFETDQYITTGIMAASKEHEFIQKLLNVYKERHFVKCDGSLDITTNVKIITNMALQYGLVRNNVQQSICGVTFFPCDYFCPKSRVDGVVYSTTNTVCIHHFNGSWLSEEVLQEEAKRQAYIRRFGKRLGSFLYKLSKYALHPVRILYRITKGIEVKEYAKYD